MIIGIGKEIKTAESRVGLLPEQVIDLIGDRHRLLVETGAGEKAGFSDLQYKEKGADIVSKEVLYKTSQMVIKVKCPLESEYGYLQDGQILFTYLHFDENISPENIEKIISRGITGIAYEWVEENGDYLLLRPMSEITGVLFALQSMKLLIEKKGLLPGEFLGNVKPPTALIIGMGRIGTNALKVFLMNGMKVIIIERSTENINERAKFYIGEELWCRTETKRDIIQFDNEYPDKTVRQIECLLPTCDIVLNCAVRGTDLPKSKMEYLITRKMLSGMRKGSIICDATACDRNMIETSISSENLYETYEIDGIVHYSCDHIPALVPGISSVLLAKKTYPYIKLLADMGFSKAVQEKKSLFKAVMCHRGKLTHELTSVKKNISFTNLKDLL